MDLDLCCLKFVEDLFPKCRIPKLLKLKPKKVLLKLKTTGLPCGVVTKLNHYFGALRCCSRHSHVCIRGSPACRHPILHFYFNLYFYKTRNMRKIIKKEGNGILKRSYRDEFRGLEGKIVVPKKLKAQS